MITIVKTIYLGGQECLPTEYRQVKLGPNGKAVWANKGPVNLAWTPDGFCSDGKALYYYRKVSGGAALKRIEPQDFPEAWRKVLASQRLISLEDLQRL